MIVSGELVAGAFVTKKADGSLLAATVGPAGVLYINGAANGAVVTIAGANPYSWSVTLPVLATGDLCQMYITATVDAIATGGFVWMESVGVVPAVPGSQMDLVNAPNAVAVLAIQAGLAVPGDAMNIVDVPNPLAVAEIQTGLALAGEAAAALTAYDPPTEAEMDAALAALHVALQGDIAGLGFCGAAGMNQCSYPVTDSTTGLPIANVRVWVTTDAAGLNVVDNGYTDMFGVVVFWLDSGDYYFWRSRSGYSFLNPDQEHVL